MKIQIVGHDKVVLYRPKEKSGIIFLFDSDAILGNSKVRNAPLLYDEEFNFVCTLVVDDLHSSAEEDYPGSVCFSSKEANSLWNNSFNKR